MRFRRSTSLGYSGAIAVGLSGMAILAGCGSTHTKTVTRTQTVTHVVKAHPKIIHRTRTVTVTTP